MFMVYVVDGKAVEAFNVNSERRKELDAAIEGGAFGNIVSRWDWGNMAAVEKMAAELNEVYAGKRVFLPCDKGSAYSDYSRYDLCEPPKVGDEVSKAFNGDYYPVGKVIAVSDSFRVVSVDGPRGKLRFYRRKNSAAWLCGGMWSLVVGSISKWNPEF